MDSLKIASTKYTPEVSLNLDTHVLEIKGECYPENTTVFFQPIFDWLKNYLTTLENQHVTFNIELVYFNSSSSKALINLFDVLEGASKKGKQVMVNWIYETDDEDMKEFGEEFEEDLEVLSFNLIEKKANL